VGGRIADRKLSEHMGQPFVFDRAGSNRPWGRSFGWLKPVSTIGLTRRTLFWQEWADLLDRWSSEA
jgi:hypothetical protein